MNKSEINRLTERWLAAGAITTEQAAYITNDVEHYISETSGNKFITAVVSIGTLGLSAGVLLIIASNWSGFSDGIKLLLALLLPIVPLTFAYWQIMMRGVATVFALVAHTFGLLLVGGAIALIEQTYHLQSSLSGTLWLWNMLTIPFLLVFKRAENVIVTTTLTAGALLASTIQYLDEADFEEGFSVMLLTIISLGFLTLMYWLGAQLRHSEVWGSGSRFLRITGATVATFILYLMTFEFYARVVTSSDRYYDYYSYTANTSWMPISIALNIGFIIFLVIALLRATKYEEYNFAFWVVRMAAVYLFTKYITLFSTMLDTGLFFVVGGLIFIVGGWLLENRKAQLIAFMKGASQERGQNPYLPQSNNDTYAG